MKIKLLFLMIFSSNMFATVYENAGTISIGQNELLLEEYEGVERVLVRVEIHFSTKEIMSQFRRDNSYLASYSTSIYTITYINLNVFQYDDGSFKNDDIIKVISSNKDIYEFQLDVTCGLLPMMYENFLKKEKEKSSCSIQ